LRRSSTRSRIEVPTASGSGRTAPVALGHALLAVSRNGVHPQPVVRNGCAIVLAGRLDNGDEVEAALGTPASGDAGDAALVLAACRKWGEDSAARLLGDFTFAIRDGARRTLVCARDSMASSRSSITRATESSSWPRAIAILADPDVPRGINEEVAAEYLTGVHRTRDATLNAAVRRVLPRAPADRQRGRAVDAPHSISIAARRSATPVTRSMPNTSSSCSHARWTAAWRRIEGRDLPQRRAGFVGHRRRRHAVGARPERPLGALALRFPGRACDEGPHIAAVARHTGIPLDTLDMVPAAADAHRIEAAATFDVPQHRTGSCSARCAPRPAARAPVSS
jgi:hypothetical protein